MRFEKIDLNYVLSFGLALTFLANSLSAFLTPDEFKDIIQQSLIFNKIPDIIPFFITLIGFNDLIVCILLISQIFPKFVAWWAVFWISLVIIVFLSQRSVPSIFTALEHSAPLAIAIYLSLKQRNSTIKI